MTTTEPMIYRGQIGENNVVSSRYKYIVCKAGNQPLSHHLNRIDALRAHESDCRVDHGTYVWEWSEYHGRWIYQ